LEPGALAAAKWIWQPLAEAIFVAIPNFPSILWARILASLDLIFVVLQQHYNTAEGVAAKR
jgi:hypothetical protein